MLIHRMRAGDNRPPIRHQFTGEDGQPLDLSGAVVSFAMANRITRAQVVANFPAVVDDAAAGEVSVSLPSAFAVEGYYLGEFRAVWTDGGTQASPASCWIDIRIAPSLIPPGPPPDWTEGHGALLLPALTASGHGVAVAPGVFYGSGALLLPALVAAGSGETVAPEVTEGAGALSLPAMIAAGAGVTVAPGITYGAGALALPPLLAAGVAAGLTTLGAGSLILPALLGSGAAITITRGSGALTLPAMEASGTAEADTDISTDVQTGSYTGTGAFQRVATDFEPALIVVAAEDTTPVMWRTDTAWQGRTQFFAARESEYAIGPYLDRVEMPLEGGGEGMTVSGNANASGIVYHWLAIRLSAAFFHSSWIGNATAGRPVDFLDEAAALAIAKRDNPTAGVARTSGGGVTLSHQTGASTAITSLTSTGIVVSAENAANQFQPPAIGEGIEGFAFRDTGNIRVLTYTGDGSGTRTVDLGLAPVAALVLDMGNGSGYAGHSLITDTMPAGQAKPLAATALVSDRATGLTGSGVTVATGLNVSGRSYTILAFAEAA